MSNERLVKLFDDLVDLLKDFIARHDLDYSEYNAAVTWLNELGQSGEVPLFTDVFLESTVNTVNFGHRPGTETAIQGPFYIEGAPLLEPPYELPCRDDQPGDVLFFSGTVTSADGRPIAGALLDLWQADGNGVYSNIDPSVPPFNMRGRFATDEQGGFEVRSVVPVSYEIPKAGPTGRLLEALGRHAHRPAHLHVTVTADGYEALTTQIYFEGDPWLDSDVAGAVKSSLVTRLVRYEDPGDYRERGLDGRYCTATFHFVLPPLDTT